MTLIKICRRWLVFLSQNFPFSLFIRIGKTSWPRLRNSSGMCVILRLVLHFQQQFYFWSLKVHSFNPSTTNKHEGSSAYQVLEAPPSVSVPPNFASSVQVQPLVPQATSLTTLEPNFHAKDRSLFMNIFKGYRLTSEELQEYITRYRKTHRYAINCNLFVIFIHSLSIFLNNIM